MVTAITEPTIFNYVATEPTSAPALRPLELGHKIHDSFLDRIGAEYGKCTSLLRKTL